MRIHCVWMWLEGWEDLAILAELGVQVGGQRSPCAPQGLGLVATTQLWSKLPLHGPATCWEDRSVTAVKVLQTRA